MFCPILGTLGGVEKALRNPLEIYLRGVMIASHHRHHTFTPLTFHRG